MASPKRFFLIFTLTFSFLGTAVAQSISGSTSVDVDQATGMVTATCETDVGGDAQSYYEAMVKCTVADGSGAQVGYAQYIDHNGALGYAQAVVSFSGVPGTAYSAMGQHLGIATLEDYAEPAPHQPAGYYFLDENNFGFYETNPVTTEPIFYTWPGPGPEQQRKTSTIHVGNTKDAQVDPVDTKALVAAGKLAFAVACDAAFTKVIGSTYTKNGFFQSLTNAAFNQYPLGAPGLPSPPPTADASTELPSPGRPIDLWPNFYGVPGHLTTTSFKEFVIIHEGIHRLTGWSDPQVFSKFYNSGLRNPSGQTNDITVWLTSGCPPS